MLRRYHYNVSADRLETHVKKGYGEGLLITAVACSKGLWAVIMDASAKRKGQVHTFLELLKHVSFRICPFNHTCSLEHVRHAISLKAWGDLHALAAKKPCH